MNQAVVARTCNQVVSWQAATGADDRTDRTYAPAANVPARKVAKSKDLVSKDGEVTTATAQLTLLFSPSIGDLLDGAEVIRVDAMTDVFGTTVGYQVYTR